MEKHTMCKQSAAGSPGGLRIDRLSYARYTGRGSLGAFLNLMGTWVPWRFNKWVPGNRAFQWRRYQEHFHHGDLTPGLILDTRRSLIAVYTNVDATGLQPAPVILVMKEDLSHIRGMTVRNGERLATLSVYYAADHTPQSGRWGTFHPIPVNSLVTDWDSRAAIFQRVTPWEWQALEAGVRQLGDEPPPGLYPVAVPPEPQ